MTVKNEKWLQTNLAWLSGNDLIRSRFAYWSSATSKVTSMGLGSQKGFIANPVNAPNVTR